MDTPLTKSPLNVTEIEGGRVVRVALDAGKGNVIDRGAIAALRKTVVECRGRSSCRALLLEHTGPHFSFGASVQEHLPEVVADMLSEFHALARELLELDTPIVAVVRGMCLGGGLELALLADRIVAAPDAVFAQPEIQLGVFAPLGSALLPRVVNPHVAADLLLTGRRVDAREAERMGLTAEVADDPSAAALTWVREHLLPVSAAALRHATRAARRAWQPGFLAELADLEAQYTGELMQTNDAREGITAFLEKRTAHWEDC